MQYFDAMTTTRILTASVCREGKWFIAQCLEVDVASQGRSEAAALRNLGDALALHFAEPVATSSPRIRAVEVKVRAA